VGLVGTKHQSFLILVDFFHEQLHPVAFAIGNFDDAVEVGFGVNSLFVYRTFNEFVFGAVDVFIKGGVDLPNFEGGEETIINAVFEGIGVDGVTEVGVGVSVVFSFRSSSESELYC